MKLFRQIRFAMVLLAAMPLGAQLLSAQQTQNPSAPVPAVTGLASTGTDDTSDRMLTPPPVSGESYPVIFTDEARSNFLRGGITFDTAYSDNVVTALDGQPVSDVTYSIFPTISIDQTRPRLHWTLSYAPGFSFYQRTSSRNEADQNLAVNFSYRLSPHVTLTLADSFQKSSSVFNQPDQGLGTSTSGSPQGAGDTVISPVADRLTNNGTVTLTYQFGANAMVGGSGEFSNLHYPNPADVGGSDPTQLTGLYDASSRVGSVFYSQRFGRKNYVGVTYQYQQLLSYPAGIADGTETDTHAVLFFYTAYATPHFSFSVFGGPQYYTTEQIDAPASQAWYPAAGASLNWQGRHTAAAASYSRMITGGGGLIGAARADSASLSFRQQLARRLSAQVNGVYSNRNVLTLTSLPTNDGHTIAGSVSLQQQLGEHVTLRAGYTRLRQVYENLAVIAPNTNREWLSIAYEFSRPLGR